MTGILNALIAGVSGAVKDAYFNLVSLLLPGNGTNGAQNNTFLDSSTNNFTITRNGNTTQGTFSPFSQTGWGNYFDGSGDYLSVANTAALQLSNSTAWTVELWFYATALASEKAIFNGFNPSGSPNYNGFGLNLGSNGQPATTLMMFDGTNWTNIATVAANQWYHVAVSYEGSGTTRRCFLNGVLQGSAGTVPSTITNTSTATAIGALSNGNFSFPGYISNVRVVKGTAVYTANFTPPTSPLTAITNTSLLTCQSNRFVDNSGTPLTITVNGNTSVVAFSPFDPTAAYTTAAVGGSGYFDGNGDYLTVDASSQIFPTGTQTYSVEFWAYPTSLTTSSYPAFCQNSATGGWQIVYFNDGSANQNKIAIGIVGTGPIGTATFNTNVNQWVHVVATRTGNDHRLFINGILQVYASNSVSFASPSGASQQIVTSGGPQTYMAGLRTILGSIPTNYQTSSTTTGTSIFTPPTSPTTTTSQGASSPAFLLNFTNAGITDATAKNDLETVGNAQISTTQSKWGGGSMYFDGTGDYLVPSSASSNILLGFGTGDFTIEFWVYFAGGLGSDILLYDGRPLSTNGAYPTIYVNSSSQLSYVVSSADRITSSSAFSTSIWYHIAVSRSGTSTKMFVNGTQVGSTYTDSTNYLSAARRPTIGINGFNESAGGLNGYIDDLRVSRVARYTANFTAPTAPFPVQ